MRLVSIDRRRESLHVGLSLCEGRARTDRVRQPDDHLSDAEDEQERDEAEASPHVRGRVEEFGSWRQDPQRNCEPSVVCTTAVPPIGRPHFGHASAASDTSVEQSGHETSAIIRG
jgi:hypothetical protein